MTAPYLPPLKSTDGITLREALTYERTVDDGEEVPPPGGPAEIADDSMAVVSGGWAVTLLAHEAEETACFPAGEDWRDARGRTLIRVVAKVHEAGAAGSRLCAKFTTNADASSSDPDAWTHAGALATEVPVSIAVVGTRKSLSWLPLHATAQTTDARWQVFAVGGDGTESPVVSDVQIQWRTAPLPVMEKWYWRNLTPAAQPDVTADTYPGSGAPIEDLIAYTGAMWGTALQARSFGFCAPPLDVAPFTAPTEATVQTNAKLLLRSKATGNLGATGFGGTGVDAREDISGWVGRLVSPPLAAQEVPAFAYEHWFTAQAPSAFTDGTVANHLWVWRPGVGRVVLDAADEFFAESFAGGFAQKYVRFVLRQCKNWGLFPAFSAQEGDRFILDIVTLNITNCGFLSHNQGLGTNVNYNGTVEPNDPEGLADTGFPGVAAYTLLPRLRYTGSS